jgi:hypothetical protein
MTAREQLEAWMAGPEAKTPAERKYMSLAFAALNYWNSGDLRALVDSFTDAKKEDEKELVGVTKDDLVGWTYDYVVVIEKLVPLLPSLIAKDLQFDDLQEEIGLLEL